jgi:hypothetical protein
LNSKPAAPWERSGRTVEIAFLEGCDMSRRRFLARFRAMAALVLIVGTLAPGLPVALGQQPDAKAPPPGLSAQTVPQLPPVPPRGAWGEVIMANAKWVVVQNHLGQQFPIAADSIGQFLIRWPYSEAAMTGQSMAEVIGQDASSNVIRTDHVDVFEGNDRNLVAPAYNWLAPEGMMGTAVDPNLNRFMFGFDMLFMNELYGWAYPMPAATMGVPVRIHVVGAVVGKNPVRLMMPGNVLMTVMPADLSGVSITQMTRGSTSFAEKGDLVFLMPVDLTTRTVALSQLVLYKKMPLREYRPK